MLNKNVNMKHMKYLTEFTNYVTLILNINTTIHIRPSVLDFHSFTNDIKKKNMRNREFSRIKNDTLCVCAVVHLNT